jgi:hypothetical protein
MLRFLDLFISINCCTCFRRFFRPSSGAQNCTYSLRYCQTTTAAYCYRGWGGTPWSFFLSIYFYKLLYMFQAVLPLIIRSTKLYIQPQVLSNHFCCLLLSWMRWNSMEFFFYLLTSINCSTCFRRFLRPSSGAQNCTYILRYCQTTTAACCYRGWDGTPWISISSTITAGSSIGLKITDVVYTVLCSWWWAEEPPESCRTIYRNK